MFIVGLSLVPPALIIPQPLTTQRTEPYGLERAVNYDPMSTCEYDNRNNCSHKL